MRFCLFLFIFFIYIPQYFLRQLISRIKNKYGLTEFHSFFMITVIMRSQSFCVERGGLSFFIFFIIFIFFPAHNFRKRRLFSLNNNISEISFSIMYSPIEFPDIFII